MVAPRPSSSSGRWPVAGSVPPRTGVDTIAVNAGIAVGAVPDAGEAAPDEIPHRVGGRLDGDLASQHGHDPRSGVPNRGPFPGRESSPIVPAEILSIMTGRPAETASPVRRPAAAAAPASADQPAGVDGAGWLDTTAHLVPGNRPITAESADSAAPLVRSGLAAETGRGGELIMEAGAQRPRCWP